jgi:tryptophanyl-tRNA synthetase
VGEDQRQHLELTRDLARRFNDRYCKGGAYKKRCKAAGFYAGPVFKEPEAMIVEGGSRVMSLADGRSKMSKSDKNDNSRINLLDPPDVIARKIKSCKTDAVVGIEWDNPDRPEATNLLNIHQACSGLPKEVIAEQVRGMSWGDYKPLLSEVVVEHLRPIQERYREVRADEGLLEDVLRRGAKDANERAQRTADHARLAMDFLPRF